MRFWPLKVPSDVLRTTTISVMLAKLTFGPPDLYFNQLILVRD
jgi:hypothetical protein